MVCFHRKSTRRKERENEVNAYIRIIEPFQCFFFGAKYNSVVKYPAAKAAFHYNDEIQSIPTLFSIDKSAVR